MFVPLDTGVYVFVASCDYKCKVYLTDLDGLTPETFTYGEPIININSPTNYRDTDAQSDPLTLEVGKQYHLEIRHIETTGTDHMTLGFQLVVE